MIDNPKQEALNLKNKKCLCSVNQGKIVYYFILTDVGDFSLTGIVANGQKVVVAYSDIGVLREMQPYEKRDFDRRRGLV